MARGSLSSRASIPKNKNNQAKSMISSARSAPRDSKYDGTKSTQSGTRRLTARSTRRGSTTRRTSLGSSVRGGLSRKKRAPTKNVTNITIDEGYGDYEVDPSRRWVIWVVLIVAVVVILVVVGLSIGLGVWYANKEKGSKTEVTAGDNVKVNTGDSNTAQSFFGMYNASLMSVGCMISLFLADYFW